MNWDAEMGPGDELSGEEWNEHVDDQKHHSDRHESGGTDELDVDGLSGQLSDAQKIEIADSLIDTLAASGLLSVEIDGTVATIHIANSDIDHNETANRTHDGDDITPETVTASTFYANE